MPIILPSRFVVCFTVPDRFRLRCLLLEERLEARLTILVGAIPQWTLGRGGLAGRARVMSTCQIETYPQVVGFLEQNPLVHGVVIGGRRVVEAAHRQRRTRGVRNGGFYGTAGSQGLFARHGDRRGRRYFGRPKVLFELDPRRDALGQSERLLARGGAPARHGDAVRNDYLGIGEYGPANQYPLMFQREVLVK